MSKARFIETANYIYPSTSCLPSIVFEQAVVGAALDAYHYSYPPVLLPAHHAAGAHGPRAGAARVAGGGLVRFLSRTASGDAGPRRAAARAGPAGRFS